MTTIPVVIVGVIRALVMVLKAVTQETPILTVVAMMKEGAPPVIIGVRVSFYFPCFG